MYKRDITEEFIKKIDELSKKMGVDTSFLLGYLTSRNVKTKKRDRTYDDLFCACGKPRSVVERKNGIPFLYPACDNPDCRKRPQHSKRMKELASQEDSPLTGLMKKGELHNKEVNTFEFRKKVLENKGIKVDAENVNISFSKMLSARNKEKDNVVNVLLRMIAGFSPECRERFIKRYPGKIDKQFIQNLNPEDFSKFKFFVWGLNTISIPHSAGRTSFYKRPLLKDLKYNKRGLTLIQLRSGYEENYIKFFEKQKVVWDYEELILDTANGGSYRPDFIIHKFGKPWVVEVKGTFFRQGEDYIKNKLIPAIPQCEELGYNFCLTFEEKPKNWGFLQKTNKEELECLLLNI
jgi:hypothetical protein